MRERRLASSPMTDRSAWALDPGLCPDWSAGCQFMTHYVEGNPEYTHDDWQAAESLLRHARASDGLRRVPYATSSVGECGTAVEHSSRMPQKSRPALRTAMRAIITIFPVAGLDESQAARVQRGAGPARCAASCEDSAAANSHIHLLADFRRPAKRRLEILAHMSFMMGTGCVPPDGARGICHKE